MKRKHLVTKTDLEKAEMNAIIKNDYVSKENYRRLKQTYDAERKRKKHTIKELKKLAFKRIIKAWDD